MASNSPVRELDETPEIRDVAHRRPRRDPPQETRFGLVHVACAGKVALIQQRFGDRAGTVGCEPTRCFGRVPIGTEQIGAEVPYKSRLVGGRYERDVVHPVANGGRVVIAKDDAYVIVRYLQHGRPDGCTRQLPSMRRWLCNVRSLLEPDQQVFAAGDDVDQDRR